MSQGRDQQEIRPALRIRRGVIGIVGRGPRFLTIRRADNLAKGGCWCFPGGHVEPGESPGRAIVREMAEELAIDVQPVERLGAVRIPDSGYVLAVWRVRLASGDPVPNEDEIAEARWLTPDEIRAIVPGLPSNLSVLDLLGV